MNELLKGPYTITEKKEMNWVTLTVSNKYTELFSVKGSTNPIVDHYPPYQYAKELIGFIVETLEKKYQ